jgi:deoxyribonuclease V
MRSRKSFSDYTILQNTLASRVVLEDLFSRPIRYVGGVDVSYSKRGRFSTACAGAVVMDPTGWSVADSASAFLENSIPYVPGYLSFREIPVLLEAYEKLQVLPDLWLVDGAGVAHPRRIGLAAHFGVLLDVPAIGVAKSRLVGRHDDLAVEKGSRVPLEDEKTGEVIGTVLRSRTDVKPLFVSPGHRVSMETAPKVVLSCCTRYRLPEPTRAAHNMVTALKKTIPSS